MLSVTLNNDGTAILAIPPISSFMMRQPNFYTFTDNELLIHYENGETIAKFEIIDGGSTLVFIESSVPLFADVGARYMARFISMPEIPLMPYTAFQPRVWLDYYHDVNIPWDDTIDLKLDEFPGVTFSWSPYHVTAHENGNIKELFGGLPIWNVFLADLNGDGFPEFCATVSFGSGLIDDRIIVYDYVANEIYELQDRGYYNYRLSLQNGRLTVTQTLFLGGAERASGEMAIIDGQLVY
jgi:hypothetical protein